jgi:CO/xanthine dehydrogenase Mo-binding subunit
MESHGFVTDIRLPQMLYALTVRSPIAKGRLISIDCPKLPGGCILVTAQDIPGKNSLEESIHPILAAEELSYIGEPVALIIGPNKNILEECLKTCKVIAEGETPVFDTADSQMIAAARDFCAGKPEEAFEDAVSVVRGEYATGIQEHWYAEPSCAVAWFEETKTGEGSVKNRGKSRKAGGPRAPIAVSAATQWPYHVKRSVAQVLGIPAASVKVMPSEAGFHLDGRLWYPSLLSCHAALGALISGKPVHLALTKGEDFSFSPKRCGTEFSISSALNEKGEITGIMINAVVNLGAYGVNACEILDNVYLGCMRVYKTKNIRFSGLAVSTNIPPQGPFAGYGIAQGSFAMERHISMVAESQKKDPSQWRIENLPKAGTFPFGVLSKEPVNGKLLIETAVNKSGYLRKWASYELLRQRRRETQFSFSGSWAQRGEGLRGIGVAMGCQGNGPLYAGIDKGNYGIELCLEKDKSLEINTTLACAGSDIGKLWKEIASNITGLDPKTIRINCGPCSPDSGPAISSRGITALTKLLEQACHAIKQKAKNQLPVTVRKTIRPQKNPLWDDYFLSPADASGGFIDSSGFIRPGRAAAVVELEIDPVEYIPWIRGIWLCVDGGKIFSQDKASRSLTRSAVQALGWAYRERIAYSAGAIPAEQFDNFEIPGLSQIPPVYIDFIPDASDEPKGIGDLPFACIPAAYLQAVSQAMDFQFCRIPLKPEDILDAGKPAGSPK